MAGSKVFGFEVAAVENGGYIILPRPFTDYDQQKEVYYATSADVIGEIVVGLMAKAQMFPQTQGIPTTGLSSGAKIQSQIIARNP